MSSASRVTSDYDVITNNLHPEGIFPFSLDDFQLNAISSLNQGRSVVVSAPTGSGKTVIGEYAIHRAIAHGNKVFYTTPLKALSNQKLRDFRKQFGSNNVGLLTGDLSLNREALILVMTTEIFRNMLYRESNEKEDLLSDVETVVLDECHYMNDAQRGTVWEESIIHCPTSVQFVALSATIANAGQLTDWIQQVHGPADLIFSDYRPVPLEFSFCSAKGLHPLLNEKGTGLHSNCKIWRPGKSHKRRGRNSKPPQPESPTINFLLAQMAERNMLPAIYFIFSRRGCDKAVKTAGKNSFLTPKQKELVGKRLTSYQEVNPEGMRDHVHIEALLNGVAAHHAGVLPAWKELIEELFQQGLVKVVFATETLAAGINMPARSTVISTLSKRTENGHRQLMGSEFLQMAGRAGRRGLDPRGYVITMQTRFEGVREAGQLATSKSDPLISQFTPSYGMVLNLLQRYDLDKSRELIERSFGRYLVGLELEEEEELLCELREELSKIRVASGDIPWEEFEYYEKYKNRLREERRLLKTLKRQAAQTLENELTLALKFANLGTLVSLKSAQLLGKVTPAVIVDKVDSHGKFPYLICLTSENVWILVACQAVVSIHAELSCLEVNHLHPPVLSRLGELVHGDEQSREYSIVISTLSKQHDMNTPQYDLAGEVLAQTKLVKSLEDHLEQQPAHKWGDRKNLKKHRRRMDDLDLEIAQREQRLHYKSNRHWDTFLSLIEVLEHFGCIECLEPSEIGRSVGSIRGENELWIGLALISGYLDDLSPSALAGVIEAISTEINRHDLWSAYMPSPSAEDALNHLSSIRRELKTIQERFNIAIPIYWNSELIGLVEAWSDGCSWSDLISNTSLDEGDVVRIMRRTIDLLSQIPHCECITNQMRNNARSALRLINRFPVCEVDDISKTIYESEESQNPASERL